MIEGKYGDREKKRVLNYNREDERRGEIKVVVREGARNER